MAHKHPIYDTDRHFVIDPYSRNIVAQSDAKLILMQFDHNSERLTFEIPREIEEHDMSLCNRVKIHYINVGPEGSFRDVHEVTDMMISPDDDQIVVLSWLVSQNATRYAGSLNFVIRFECINEETGESEYAWHSNIFAGLKISNGINNSESLVDYGSDTLEKWRIELVDAGILAASQAAENVMTRLNASISRAYGTVTLPMANWANNTQTVNITDLGDNCHILFTPANKESQSKSSIFGLFVEANDTEVTFTVDEVPDADLTLNYLVIGFNVTESGASV